MALGQYFTHDWSKVANAGSEYMRCVLTCRKHGTLSLRRLWISFFSCFSVLSHRWESYYWVRLLCSHVLRALQTYSPLAMWQHSLFCCVDTFSVTNKTHKSFLFLFVTLNMWINNSAHVLPENEWGAGWALTRPPPLFNLLLADCRLQLSSSHLLSSCPCCRKIKKKKRKRRNLTSHAVPSRCLSNFCHLRCLIPSEPPLAPPPPTPPLYDLLKQHTLACLSKPRNRCSSKDLTPPCCSSGARVPGSTCACTHAHIYMHTHGGCCLELSCFPLSSHLLKVAMDFGTTLS